MKNYSSSLFTPLILVLLVSGCFKDSLPTENVTDPIPNDNQVITTNLPGTYTWVKSVHPSTNEVTTPQSTGEQERLEISSTSFQLFRNGELVDEFPYITQRTSADQSNTTYRIINADGGSERYTFYFTNTLKLFIQESCCQRLLIEYERR